MKKSIKRIIILVIIIVIGVIIDLAIYRGGRQKQAFDFVVAQTGDLIQEVNVTGQVRPAENIDLAFEASGKVAQANIQVGDIVRHGQVLASLNNTDTRAQIAQAQANLESAQAILLQYEAALEIQEVKLEELRQGSRPEEIQLSQTKVLNAERALADAQINLANSKTKAKSDLQAAYENALFAADKSITIASQAIFTLTDIQYAHFYGFDQESIQIANAKAEAVFALLGGQNAGRWTNEFISQLNGGAKAKVTQAQVNPLLENIDIALTVTREALQKVKAALETVPQSPVLSPTETTNLLTEKNNINSELINLNTKSQTIEIQKITNQSNIALAETRVNEAQNLLKAAEAELELKQAGATPEQIALQQAQIRQAQANLASQESLVKSAQASLSSRQAQLAKTIISSPINGIVIKQDAKPGEIVPANLPLISIMSSSQFQIEVYIAEVDIAKVKLTDKAQISLDAYGQDEIFQGQVVSIEPAETLVEGVASYKTILEFIREDERIKSGMTANIDILTDKRENVISIPQRAVISKDGQKFVRLLEETVIRTVSVQTGLRGSDGHIEIVKGVQEDDKVIVFMEEK